MADENKKLTEKGDNLYDRYGKPLEAEHWGEFVAIAEDGRTLLAPDLRGLLEETEGSFGPQTFIFKVGERAVGHIR